LHDYEPTPPLTFAKLLTDCIPHDVHQFLLKSSTRVFHNRSIIANLACGASVQNDESRVSLCNGYVRAGGYHRLHVLTHSLSHDAEAVLSLANTSTVVGDVATPVAEFLVAWIQTSSDYDTLFAKVLRDVWAREHKPVLSTGPNSHTLYTGYDPTEPGGLLALCHHGCGMENQSVSSSGPGSDVRIKCRECRSSCTFPRPKKDQSTALGSRSLIKTPYPQGRLRTQWVFDDPSVLDHTKMKVEVVPMEMTRRVTFARPSKLLVTSTKDRVLQQLEGQPASLTTHLIIPPPQLSRSSSLPIAEPPKPKSPAPVPTPNTSLLTVKPPRPLTIKLPRRVQAALQTTPQVTPQVGPQVVPRVAPQIARSQSTPESRKRQSYPVLELSTSGSKRQKKK
jgi:hypothetical protein